MRRVLAVLSTAVLVAGPLVSTAPASASPIVPPSAEVVLRTAGGATIGTAVLTDLAGATRVRVRASGLTPGFHGFHVHAVGQCDPSTATPFTSAGGHWNPEGSPHGSHDGDMPPLYADAQGVVAMEFVTDAFRISAINDSDGAALIVHADRDNLAHIPARYTFTNPDGTTGTGPDATTKATGDASTRFACGVVPAEFSSRYQSMQPTRSRTARAVLRTASGASAGTVRFGPVTGDRVHVSVDASNLTPGFHGFHVHAVGQCDPTTTPPFTSAGGHLGSGSADHGSHDGDLPPLFATADGRARAEFDTDAFTLAQVLDADGGAIVVHAAPDNLAHIPTRYTYTNPDGSTGTGPDAVTKAAGDAGARALCGVVVVPPAPASVSVQPTVPVITAGNAPTLQVTVRDAAGAGAPDVEVELFFKPWGAREYSPFVSGFTDEQGALLVRDRPFTQTAYVARVAGLPDARTLIAVHARVTISSVGALEGGQRFTFQGHLLPAYAGAAVGVAALTGDPSRPYRYLGETRTSADGTFSVSVAGQPDARRYVVYTPARAGTRRGSATFGA